jgi:hypothetical protein
MFETWKNQTHFVQESLGYLVLSQQKRLHAPSCQAMVRHSSFPQHAVLLLPNQVSYFLDARLLNFRAWAGSFPSYDWIQNLIKFIFTVSPFKVERLGSVRHDNTLASAVPLIGPTMFEDRL